MSKSEFKRLTNHVYWLTPDETTDRPVLGAIVGTAGTLIIDAGNSTTHASLLLDGLVKIGIASPKYLVLTHWHWDHVFGTAAFNVPTFATQETKRIVEEMAGWDWSDEALDARVEAGIEIEFCRDMIKKELPDRSSLVLRPPGIAFSHEIAFDLGDVTCRVVHVGGDHAGDACVVYIPEDKVVFLSDCLSPDLYSAPWQYTTKKLFPLLDKILSFEAEYFLFGHDSVVNPRAEIVEFAEYLRSIGRKVDEVGRDRERICLELVEAFQKPLDEDDLETIDFFLAGL